MIEIELMDDTILRGQSLKGKIDISSLSPFNAKNIKAVIRLREKYSYYFPTIRGSTSTVAVLFDAKDMEITNKGKK